MSRTEAGTLVVGLASAYRGNVWRLFAVQALLMFILWVPIWPGKVVGY